MQAISVPRPCCCVKGVWAIAVQPCCCPQEAWATGFLRGHVRGHVSCEERHEVRRYHPNARKAATEKQRQAVEKAETMLPLVAAPEELVEAEVICHCQKSWNVATRRRWMGPGSQDHRSEPVLAEPATIAATWLAFRLGGWPEHLAPVHRVVVARRNSVSPQLPVAALPEPTVELCLPHRMSWRPRPCCCSGGWGQEEHKRARAGTHELAPSSQHASGGAHQAKMCRCLSRMSGVEGHHWEAAMPRHCQHKAPL